MSGFFTIVRRDLRLAFSQGGAALLTVAFFILAASLFPLGLGPDPGLLARIAAGVIWVCALLAALLSLDRLFQADYEDGSIDLLVLSPLPLGAVVLAKCFAHWLSTGVPLLMAAPVIALLFNMQARGYGVLIAALALGTPSLSLIGAIGAALTVGIRRAGVLITLIVLPLYVPVLIFGVLAVEAVLTGLDPAPHLKLEGAMLLISLVIAPPAARAALKLALS